MTEHQLSAVLAEKIASLSKWVEHVDECIDELKLMLFDDDGGRISKLERKLNNLDRRLERMVLIFAFTVIVMSFLSGSGTLSLQKLLAILAK